MKIVPTPAAARYWIAGDPIPPAPTTNIRAALSRACPPPPTSRSTTWRRDPPGPPHGLVEAADFLERRVLHRCRHELGNPVSARDREGRVAEIGEDHLHLAAIVAVDRARRVEAGDAVLEREARARADLDLIAR